MISLVTGATGFIGGHLVGSLATGGRKIRALVRPARKGVSGFAETVEIAYGDLNDEASLKKALKGVDIVFHCAGCVSDWGDPALFRKTNVDGLRSLLSASESEGVKRFVHVSTSDVYGYPGTPADETAPYRRRGFPYTDTKIEGEELVWRWHRDRGLPVTAIRPVSVYGPRSQTLVMDIARLLRSGDMINLGPTSTVAGLCHVSNLVDAIVLASSVDRAVGRAYNISDGSGVTWREYVDALADAIGSPRPKAVIPRPIALGVGWAMETWGRIGRKASRPLLTRMAVEIFTTHQAFSIKRAMDELGYRPAVDFKAGMAGIKEWLRSEGV